MTALVSGVYTAGVATRMSGNHGMDPVAHGYQALEAATREDTMFSPVRALNG